MKDMTMTRQEQLLNGKAVLDKIIKRTSALAQEAWDEALVLCKEGELDARDDLQEVASCLRAAEANLIMARSKAGRIDTGGMTRSGGT